MESGRSKQKRWTDPFGIPRRWREDNKKIDQIRCEDVNWIHLGWQEVKWGTPVNTFMMHQLSLQNENFFQQAFIIFCENNHTFATIHHSIDSAKPKQLIQIWCDFDRASSLICANKMPTRCNRGFYCRSYCLLNLFRAPLCPSSGAQEYYTVVAACSISCCGFQVAGLVWSWGICVRFAGCCSTEIPQAATTV